MNQFLEIVKDQLPYSIYETDFNIGTKYKGKVRDVYDLNDKLLIITTDRISAFDRVLGVVPFKGEILNNLSLFWFDKTKDILENHVIKKIEPNGMLVKKCNVIPIEIIVRGYLTGGGWREYQETGKVSGIQLPKNLKKDSKFDKPIITPTTKAKDGHDIPIGIEEIIERKIVTKELIEKIEFYALKIFERGQEIANKNNLILVDTKYEFGLTEDDKLMLIDEIHTSDSSRYWYLDSYEKLFDEDKEQRMLDKEYLRQFLIKEKNYKGDGPPPDIPLEVISGILERYLIAYETITSEKYELKIKDANKILKLEVEKIF